MALCCLHGMPGMWLLEHWFCLGLKGLHGAGLALSAHFFVQSWRLRDVLRAVLAMRPG